jgi:hypothetical protein
MEVLCVCNAIPHRCPISLKTISRTDDYDFSVLAPDRVADRLGDSLQLWEGRHQPGLVVSAKERGGRACMDVFRDYL